VQLFVVVFNCVELIEYEVIPQQVRYGQTIAEAPKVFDVLDSFEKTGVIGNRRQV
jgi:hypothetical protein